MSVTRLICLACAIAHAILFFVLLADAQAVIASFGIATSEAVAFVGRRAAMLFLGLSALSAYGALRPKVGPLFLALLSLPWLGLAVMGGYEHLRGYVGSAIYPALIIELTMGSFLLGAATAHWAWESRMVGRQ